MQIEYSNFIGRSREIPEGAPAWARKAILEIRAGRSGSRSEEVLLGPQGEPLPVRKTEQKAKQRPVIAPAIENTSTLDRLRAVAIF